MKRLVLWVSILVLLLSVATSVLANEIDQHKNEAKGIEKDINETKDSLEQVKAEQAELTKQLEKIEKDIKDKEKDLLHIQKRLDDTEILLEKTRIELQNAEEEAQRFEELMSDRLCAMYMMEGTSYLELLFGARSLNDFLDRLEMVKFMITFDNQVFDKMTDLQNTIRKQEEELEIQEENIKKTRDEVSKQKSLIEGQRSERLRLMIELKEEEDQHAKDLEILEQTSKDLEKTIQRLIEEQERKRREEEERRREEERKRREEEQKEQDRGSQNDEDKYTGGTLTWPTPGFYRITDTFRIREVHPVTGQKETKHNGIDIGKNLNPYREINGTNAVAAAEGVVILSQYYGGYGNCVIIDHGEGISTVYAHGSQVLVSAGQRVTRGQAVLRVGTTGISTGPHLHFEVREYGVPVDPLPYLGR